MSAYKGITAKRLETAIRLMKVGEAKDHSRWKILHVEGRPDWQWGMNMDTSNKSLLSRREGDVLLIDKWLSKYHNWLTMNENFTRLIELALWPDL